MNTTGQFEIPLVQSATIAKQEKQKSLMLRAWILSGLFFMALPGTLLGFSNLMEAYRPRGWRVTDMRRCLAGSAASSWVSDFTRNRRGAVQQFGSR
jgi:hypothetical protein